MDERKKNQVLYSYPVETPSRCTRSHQSPCIAEVLQHVGDSQEVITTMRSAGFDAAGTLISTGMHTQKYHHGHVL